MSSEESTWGSYKLPIFQKIYIYIYINFPRLLFGAGGGEGGRKELLNTLLNS